MTSFNYFPQIITQLHTAASQAVEQTAHDMEARAKAAAPVKSGNMRDSIYSLTSNGSTYNGAGHDALPEVDRPTDDQTAFVAVAASYGQDVEMGTHRMGPHPFLIPAAEAARSGFQSAMEHLEDALKGGD